MKSLQEIRDYNETIVQQCRIIPLVNYETEESDIKQIIAIFNEVEAPPHLVD